MVLSVKQIWPFDNYSEDTINMEHLDEDAISMSLLDLCRFAPNLLQQAGFDLNRCTSMQGKTKIHQYMCNAVSQCTTVKEIAELCLDLCSPYKYPKADPDIAESDYVSALCLDDFFQPEQFNQAATNYLLLQYLYVNDPIKADVIPKKAIKLIKRKFSTQQLEFLNLCNHCNFDYTGIPPYLPNIANLRLTPNQSSELNVLDINSSLYDFILAAGFYTTPLRWNPYITNWIQTKRHEKNKESMELIEFGEQFSVENYTIDLNAIISSKINMTKEQISKIERLIKSGNLDIFKKLRLKSRQDYLKAQIDSADSHLNKLVKFLSKRQNQQTNYDMINEFINHFYFRDFLPWEKGNNFVSVSSYIIERITHFNFINFQYNLFDEFGFDFSSFLSIFAIYPLVSYRLKLLDSLRQFMKESPEPHENDSKSKYRTCFNDIKDMSEKPIRAKQLNSIIEYQSLFYFPLLTKLFHKLLSLKYSRKSKLNGLISPSDNFILKENICPMFTFSDDNTRQNSKKLPHASVAPIELCDFKHSEQKIIKISRSGHHIKTRNLSIYYHAIQKEIYQYYYSTVRALRNYDFIDDGFKHLEKDMRFVRALEKEHKLFILEYLDDNSDMPQYVHYKSKES